MPKQKTTLKQKTKAKSSKKDNAKRQLKTKPKAENNAHETRVSELDRLIPFRMCYVCARESRDLLMIGPGKFRHQDCNPGSPNWCEYYEANAALRKSDAAQNIYDHVKGTK